GGFTFHQQLWIAPQRRGNAVHPGEREVAHPRLEPADRLRGRRRIASGGHFGQSHSLLLADIADAVDHGHSLSNQIGFSFSYSHPLLARGSFRLVKGIRPCSATSSNGS